MVKATIVSEIFIDLDGYRVVISNDLVTVVSGNVRVFMGTLVV